MRIDREAVERVIDLLAGSDAAEIEIEDGETLVRVSRMARAPEVAPAVEAEGQETPEVPMEAAQPDEAAESEARVEYVTAGLVGLFHQGPAPDEEPMVQVGDVISAGEVIGTIEALRKLTDVVSPYDGEVIEVLVDDGEAVQYGDRLFAVRVEEA
ncbi:MAG: biotin/lipoyl-containing protein [Armatimonadota bacterium]|nr:biotin/lipoyl-containing protein [Armatimonadota bacterium]